MNDKTSFERYVIEAFDREGPGRPVPDAIHDELITRAGRQRQWPTWLASVKEPPMRLTNSNAVGSPTIRVLATMAATLLLILAMALVGVAGKSLLAADSTIVVDPQGNGDFTTINEAVAAAEDGDTVVLRAGNYPESVLVTKAITIRGEEPGTAVIDVAVGCTTDTSNWETTCPPGVPTYPLEEGDVGGPYGFALEGVDATISDVRVHIHTLAAGVIVNGGSVALEGLSATTEPDVGLVMNFDGGSRVSVEGSDLGRAWLLPNPDSHVTIEDSDFEAIFANHTADTEPYVLRDNRITGTIYFTGPMIIEGNEFIGRAEGWQFDPYITADGMDWVVQDNTFVGAQGPNGAINVGHMAGPGTIEGNTFTDNEVGILTASRDVLEVAANVISGGDTGIQLNGGTPSLVGNTIEGLSESGVTMIISAPTLSGNTMCDSDVDLFIGSGSEPVVDADNEICVTKTPE